MSPPSRHTVSIRPALFSALFSALFFAACEQAADPPAPALPEPQPTVADYTARAKAHLGAGNLKAAEEACRAGLEADSTAVDLYNLLATVHASGGRYALAIEALEQALVLSPDYALGHLNLGGIYTKLGKFDQAEHHLQETLRLKPEESSLRRRLGELYLNTQRFDPAAENLRQAITLLPDAATLYFYLGQALEGGGQHPEALQAYQRATELDIGFTDAYYRLATAARRGGEAALATAALQRYRHLQAIGGGDSNVPKQLGRLRAAVLAAPEDAPHHLRLGLFFLQHDYLEEALDKFARTLALSRLDPALPNRIAGALLEKGHTDPALDYYRQAVGLDSTFVPAQVNTGSLLSLAGRHTEALPHFQSALRHAPRDPRTHYYAALGFYRTGQTDRARQLIEAGLQLPKLSPAQEQQMKQFLTSIGDI